MRKIPLTHSLPCFLDELEYTEAALASWPETTHLSAMCREEIEGYEDAALKERTARRSVARAEALVAAGTGRVEGLTLRFGGVLLAQGDGDHTRSLLQRFFPESRGMLNRRSLRQQCERILEIFVSESAAIADSSALRPVADELRAAAEEALAAIDVRTTAKASRAVMGSAVDDWKEGVNRLRLSMYGELLRIAAENGYEKAWVDAFFPSSARAQPEDSEEVPLEPAAANGA